MWVICGRENLELRVCVTISLMYGQGRLDEGA